MHYTHSYERMYWRSLFMHDPFILCTVHKHRIFYPITPINLNDYTLWKIEMFLFRPTWRHRPSVKGKPLIAFPVNINYCCLYIFNGTKVQLSILMLLALIFFNGGYGVWLYFSFIIAILRLRNVSSLMNAWSRARRLLLWSGLAPLNLRLTSALPLSQR